MTAWGRGGSCTGRGLPVPPCPLPPAPFPRRWQGPSRTPPRSSPAGQGTRRNRAPALPRKNGNSLRPGQRRLAVLPFPSGISTFSGQPSDRPRTGTPRPLAAFPCCCRAFRPPRGRNVLPVPGIPGPCGILPGNGAPAPRPGGPSGTFPAPAPKEAP